MQNKPALPQYITERIKIPREEYEPKQITKKQDNVKKFFKQRFFKKNIREEYERDH